MSNNSILNKAKYSENTDEWYTDYKTVETEVSNYTEQFCNKIVLCNCDDPYQSAFANYFLKNFNNLQLKKLICTSYKSSRIVDTLNLKDDEKRNVSKTSAYVMEISKIPDELITDDDISKFLESNKVVKRLKGDGDFRSEECIKYLQEADIIVTNPPFSKFIELFTLLVKYNKKYFIIT